MNDEIKNAIDTNENNISSTLYPEYEDFGFNNNIEGAPDSFVGLDEPEVVAVGISKTNQGIGIKRKITTVNRTRMSNKVNKYIVIHYVGAVSTAASNASYFYSVNRGASAHYFVDPNEIWQVVEDYDSSWHCGGGLQSNRGATFYKKCLNSNSIGIEMCMKYDSSGRAYFEEGTIKNTIDLTKTLMQKYNIPIDRVIRHFDVVGKICPEPYVRDESAWKDFLSKVSENYVTETHWAEEYFNFFVSKGYISNPEIWSKYDSYVTKSEAVALLDKISGGMWTSDESNASIHWVQPHCISMCGKGYLDSKTLNSIWLTNPDAYISKAQVLGILDKMTGGMLDKYVNSGVDHWGRRHLNSLCDKAIVETPSAWADSFEGTVTRGLFMALVTKTIKSGKIK